MKSSRLSVALLLLFFALSAGYAQQGRLLVAQKGYRSLAIVDPAAGTVIASVPEGGITGHEVAASPDGRFAYVPIYGNSGVGKPGSDGRNMVVIDIAAQKVVASVDFGHGVRPHMPILGPKDGLLYVTTELDNAVTIVDPKTLKIVGSIPTGQAQSHMLALSHDGRRGYTSNVEPGSVSVLDIAARKTLEIIPISPIAQRISISNDDRWVFTADQTKPRLAVIDTTTNKLKSWIPLDAVGYGSAPTLDGRWLLLAMPDQNKRSRHRPPDHAGRALGCGWQGSAGGPGSPRRQGGVCLLHRQQPGCRNRSGNVEGYAADRHRQGYGWPRLGRR